MSVKIVYGAGPVTLTFVRGPVNLRAGWNGRVHDNLATSGAARERVVEALDILISFDTPHLVIDGDMAAWAAFEKFGLGGGGFRFYPSDGLADYYNCVLEDVGWEPARKAPKHYGAAVVLRILADAQAPSGPDVVLRRFYGIAA